MGWELAIDETNESASTEEPESCSVWLLPDWTLTLLPSAEVVSASPSQNAAVGSEKEFETW